MPDDPPVKSEPFPPVNSEGSAKVGFFGSNGFYPIFLRVEVFFQILVCGVLGGDRRWRRRRCIRAAAPVITVIRIPVIMSAGK